MAVTPLCTTDDLEDALGRELTAEETTRATHYISAISAFVAGYCDLIELGLKEDDVVRFQADVYGIVDLGGGPISSVTTVTDVLDSTEVTGFTFDGNTQVSGLAPYQTVDVTMTHGTDTIPDDLKNVAVDALLGIVAVQATGPLVRRTVGDVTHVYADQNGNVVLALEQRTLDRYRTTAFQYRVGEEFPARYIHSNDLQTGR